MGGLGKNVSADSYSFLSAHSEEFPLISSFPLSLFLLHRSHWKASAINGFGRGGNSINSNGGTLDSLTRVQRKEREEPQEICQMGGVGMGKREFYK